MSKTSTFNAGMKMAQSGKPMPGTSGLSYQSRQDFTSGYKFGACGK
ncbi:hypothetical protein [Palleronia pelagia]|uniref:Uncharacterized protein n=1 Tax=Palleronia pelagia TaxID=387096 RepID=A0A1H8C177_9RHOB|nr:hypothetical protein [Palleronia pelagia]SEM88941.1 hypothetical protein SAMN04488011_101828 [Palleronia pelagia]